jgi:hypothetical protein
MLDVETFANLCGGNVMYEALAFPRVATAVNLDAASF